MGWYTGQSGNSTREGGEEGEAEAEAEVEEGEGEREGEEDDIEVVRGARRRGREAEGGECW